MKFTKKIAAWGAAAIMISSMVIAAGAVEYCGGQNKTKAWLTKDGNACYRPVGDIFSYGGGPVSSGTNLGTIKASYTPGAGVKCTSYSNHRCDYHYARVVSGGKSKEGGRASQYWFSETGCVDLKNDVARFEGYYVIS